MSITIKRSVDIEDVIREALTGYIKAYCRPLPATFVVPSILVSKVGGTDRDTIDSLEVTLDARAEDAATADLTLRNAIGLLKKVSDDQTTAIRNVTVNTSGSWGYDPMRPELAMCSARITITAHQENAELTEVI